MQSKINKNITEHESKINEYITEHGSLGAKIRLMRQQAGLTRSYLSELSTIPEVTIRSWESNKRTPSLVNLNKLILVFKKFNIEVNLSWFRDNYFRNGEKIINKAQNILFNPELFAEASSNVLSYIKNLRSKPTLFDVQREIEQEYMKILLDNSTKKMKDKMTIGFYSKSIARTIYIILFTTFFVTSLLTIRHSLNNYKATVLKQTTLLREEFDINASVFGYILKNNFLPVITDTLATRSLDQLHQMLAQFKNNISFSSVLENIVILNKEGKAIATSESNISSNLRNLSLNDRYYLQEAKNNPNEVIYGDPVIGKISNKLALPIAIAIKSNTTLVGYIVVSINLNEFSKDLLTSNFSNILSNIAFSQNFINKNTFITNIHTVENLTLKDFILKLLKNHFNPEFHAVTIKLITSNQALYFIYDFQKVLNEALHSIICHSIILLLLFTGVYMLYTLYDKYILKPITVLNNNYQSLLSKHSQLLNSDTRIVPLSELGNLDLLNTLGITLSNKIEEYEEIFKVRDEAVKIAINCNLKVLDAIRSKASFSNETITDMIEDLKNHQNIHSTMIFTYLNDLYRHGIEKLEILETYKQNFKYIVAGISERKIELDLEKILLCFDTKNIKRLKIKSFIKNNNGPRTLKVYGDPFAQTLISVANYITQNYEDSTYTTEVVLNNSEDNFIIDFVLTTKYNTLEYQNKHTISLEEAKIYALINGGIISKTFGDKCHVITIAYGYI